MLKKLSVQQKLFYAQLLLNSIVILIFSIVKNQTVGITYLIINLLALWLVLGNPSARFDKYNRILQIVAQAVIIPISYSYLVAITNFLPWTSLPFVWFTILWTLLMYIPYIYILIVPIKTVIMRIFILIFSFLFTATSSLDLMVEKTPLSSNVTIQTFSNTLFDGALIMVVIILISMNQWDYGFPKMKLSKYVKPMTFGALLIFTLWFVFWNAFSSGNNLVASFFTYRIGSLNFTTTNILGGLEAGIAEELIFRFGILTILLSAFYNSRNKYLYSVLISSFLFGTLHGINALGGQDMGNTIIQIMFAFSFGFYLASMYLYTDSFYLVVIFHALLDTLVFLTSNNEVMTGKVSIDNILGTGIESLVFIVLGLLLLQAVKKRKRTFQFNLFN